MSRTSKNPLVASYLAESNLVLRVGKGLWLYTLNVLLAFDRFVAAMLGFDGLLTISALLGRLQGRCSLCKFVCRLLDKVDEDHCRNSVSNWTTFSPWDRSIWRFHHRD